MKKKTFTELQLRQMLANNLKHLRRSQHPKISQAMLARILHLPLKTIQNYESGRTSPTAYAVFMISAYFNCSMEALLTTKLYTRKDETNEK